MFCRFIACGALILGVSLFNATSQAQSPTPVAENPGQEPAYAPPSGLPPLLPRNQPPGSLQVVPLGSDIVVTVKDFGDSQTVMVYRVDAKGKVSLTHKARFFY